MKPTTPTAWIDRARKTVQHLDEKHASLERALKLFGADVIAHTKAVVDTEEDLQETQQALDAIKRQTAGAPLPGNRAPDDSSECFALTGRRQAYRANEDAWTELLVTRKARDAIDEQLAAAWEDHHHASRLLFRGEYCVAQGDLIPFDVWLYFNGPQYREIISHLTPDDGTQFDPVGVRMRTI